MSTFHSSRNLSVKNLFVLSFKHAKFLLRSHNSSFYKCILCIVTIRSNRDQDKRKRNLHILFDIELIHTQRWVEYVSGWFKRSLKFPWVRILKSADHRQAGDRAKLEVATALDLHGSQQGRRCRWPVGVRDARLAHSHAFIRAPDSRQRRTINHRH